jgi:hypothetical protein
VDKVLLWGVLKEKSFICAVSHRCLWAQGGWCKGCQQWAIVDPEKLAALEASLAAKDEDARVGRAVAEWVASGKPLPRLEWDGYRVAVEDLRKVIAQAREGEPIVHQ